MDYKEMMVQYSPKDCQPTVVDPRANLAKARKELAKEKGVKPEELTEEDSETALAMCGLCDLDLMIP